MTEVAQPVVGRELGKLAAFVRRDLLVLFSYRLAFLSDIANLAFQSVTFYFVGRMINPDTLPEYSGEQASYMAFVGIGIALGAFMQIGLGRVVAAIRSEQVLGTLESLFMTPTRPLTIQVGLVVYDLIYVPVRTAVFLAIIMGVFGVRFDLGAVLPSLAVLLAFIPMVWGLGMIGAAAVLTFRRGGGIVGFVAAAVSIASGAYFPLDLFPESFVRILELSPVAVAFESTRNALIGGAGMVETLPDVLYLMSVAVVLLAAGLWAVRAAIERERRMGTLSHY